MSRLRAVRGGWPQRNARQLGACGQREDGADAVVDRRGRLSRHAAWVAVDSEERDPQEFWISVADALRGPGGRGRRWCGR